MLLQMRMLRCGGSIPVCVWNNLGTAAQFAFNPTAWIRNILKYNFWYMNLGTTKRNTHSKGRTRSSNALGGVVYENVKSFVTTASWYN